MDWKLKKYPLYHGSVKQAYLSKSAVVGNLIFLSSFDGRSFRPDLPPVVVPLLMLEPQSKWPQVPADDNS